MTDEITVEEVTSEVTADKGVTRRRKLVVTEITDSVTQAEPEVTEITDSVTQAEPEVTEITDSVTQAEPEVYMSAQTRAEMAYGAETLKKNAVNSAAE